MSPEEKAALLSIDVRQVRAQIHLLNELLYKARRRESYLQRPVSGEIELSHWIAIFEREIKERNELIEEMQGLSR